MELVLHAEESVEMIGGKQERQEVWYHRAPGKRWWGTTSASTFRIKT